MLVTADWTLNELESSSTDIIQIRTGKKMKNTEKCIRYKGCRERANIQISRIPEGSEQKSGAEAVSEEIF